MTKDKLYPVWRNNSVYKKIRRGDKLNEGQYVY